MMHAYYHVLPSNNYHYFVIPTLGSSLELLFLFVFNSIPVWSRHHPQIPQRYVPQWTQDMKNRSLILEVGFGSVVCLLAVQSTLSKSDTFGAGT